MSPAADSLPAADTSGLTFAICTRNRADVLPDALQAALAQACEGIDLDVLVVDNGSTDATADVVRGFQRQHPELRLVEEPRGGLSVARNRALTEARHDIVAFVDDDAILPPAHARTVLAFWTAHRPACLGGPVAIDYPDPEPAGWSPAHESIRGAYDPGGDARPLPFGEFPEGCNIAFDRRLALAVGGFDEQLGVRPDGPWAAEEIELAAWLARHGHAVWFSPDLRVVHRPTRAERDEAWLRRMAYYRGRSHVYSLRAHFGTLRWRTVLRLFLADAVCLLPWHTLERRTRMAMAWGKLTEATRLCRAGALSCPRAEPPTLAD